MSTISDPEIGVIFRLKNTADGCKKKPYPMQLVISKKGANIHTLVFYSRFQLVVFRGSCAQNSLWSLSSGRWFLEKAA